MIVLRLLGLLFVWGSTAIILHTLYQLNRVNPYMYGATLLLAYALMIPSAVYISLHMAGRRRPHSRAAAPRGAVSDMHPLSVKQKRLSDSDEPETFEALLSEAAAKRKRRP